MKQEAEWYVRSFADLLAALQRYTVAVVGSGAWACAAARIVAQNTLQFDPADEFTDTVKMWVYDEDVGVRPRPRHRLFSHHPLPPPPLLASPVATTATTCVFRPLAACILSHCPVTSAPGPACNVGLASPT